MSKAARPIPALALLVAFAVAPVASADGVTLHVFVPPDPDEDVSLAATTLDGNLPAAIETPSGIATAPDPQRPPENDKMYTGGTTDDTPDSTYEPDRDTSQPNVENYEDPFSPSTAPFKRLRAYDSLSADYTLRVADKSTSLITVGGDAGADDEPFYGDFSVEVLPDELVRIPSVGPGARILKMHVSPTTQVSLLRDGADNWFMRGAERKRVRVVMQLAIARATFGSEFRDATWDELARKMPTDFARHDAQAEQVFAAIGVSKSMRPRDALTKMVEYFRGFQPSSDPPKSHNDMYLDLALSKKGVCRHRAFAFLVTALQLGMPARMVTNEAHAWVEVFDSVLWHRIDLGGAALDLDNDLDPTRPQHQPPKDPFTWPEGSQDNSGQGLAQREASANGGQTDPNAPPDPNGASALDPNSPDATSTSSDLPASKVEAELVDKTVRRGKSLKVKGKVVGDKQPCANVRVDVVLRHEDQAAPRPIGSLSTDADGNFEGSVIVPRDIPVDDYDVVVVTRGNKTCGAGRSE
ncbi:MAG: transglutaminase domain-containing protein [Polyangiaceae bacterium]|nr:transglutaminase domain-containing protein [Polyangiaceae bacterium]